MHETDIFFFQLSPLFFCPSWDCVFLILSLHLSIQNYLKQEQCELDMRETEILFFLLVVVMIRSRKTGSMNMVSTFLRVRRTILAEKNPYPHVLHFCLPYISKKYHSCFFICSSKKTLVKLFFHASLMSPTYSNFTTRIFFFFLFYIYKYIYIYIFWSEI